MLEKQPQLSDGVITLKQLSTKDSEALFKMHSDKKMCKKAGLNIHHHIGETYLFIKNVGKKIRKRQFYYWGIFKDKVLVGVISLWSVDHLKNSGELGYFISSDYLRQGYMTRALKLVVNFLLSNSKLDKIQAYIEEDNYASKSLVKKLGFTLVNKTKEEAMSDDIMEMSVFEISKEIQ